MKLPDTSFSFLSAILFFSVTVPLPAATSYTAPRSFATGVNFSVQQIGQDGDTGKGGMGGAGGYGGYGGFYDFDSTGWNPGHESVPGGNGGPGETGNRGGTGGTGGDGTLLIQYMGPGEALTNRGEILLGGNAGAPGQTGVVGNWGAGGGKGGPEIYGSGLPGNEPQPDPWPTTQQGGSGARYLGNGENGVNGGGGGGGSGAGILGWFTAPGGYGGDGGGGARGAYGAGGSGTKGADETIVQATNGIISAGSALQIGGNGGSGGQGGQGGQGGGGGGGAGANLTLLLPIPVPFSHGPSEGGKPGSFGAGGQGGSDGAAGNGTMVVGDRGKFINEEDGIIQVGRGSGLARGELQVTYGGRLINKGAITLDNGGLTLDRGAFVENNGSIYSPTEPINVQTAATVVNIGTITTPLFENNGFLSGAGSITGNLANYLEFAPGNSTGEMAIQGNYNEYFRLIVELASIDDYDYLTVDGNIVFGSLSTLHLDFLDTFGESGLKHNDSFDLIRYSGDLFGVLDGIDDSNAPLTRGMWDLDYNYDLGGNWRSMRLSYNVVPIPGALLLFGSSLALLTLVGSRRRNHKHPA